MQTSNKYICSCCKHYLGWNDWAIPCEIKYDNIDKDLNACESFEPNGKARCMFRNVPIDKNGLNANVKAHILPDNEMRKIGFTDFDGDSWYFCKKTVVSKVTFNVIIPKDNLDNIRINILDEEFLQPYDYQSILERNPKNKYAIDVMKSVNKYMAFLIDNGVLTGWKVGDYL